jgi:hypothetical protein
LRGNEFGQVNFGQILEWIRSAQIYNEGVITELKPLHGQRRMANAVVAGVATIIIVVLFERGTGALVRYGYFRMRRSAICFCHRMLHGMGTFMDAIDRDSQHDYEEKSGKEL